MLKKRRLTRKEVDDLALRAQQGSRRACGCLIIELEPFLYKLGKMWFARLFRDHRDDLMQELRLAVVDALKRFDPAKGAFSTYLTWWVKARGMGVWKFTLREKADSLDGPELDGFQVPDRSYERDIEEADARALGPRLRRAMGQLPKREQQVLAGRFGREESLDVVGRRFGICRERARQLEARALVSLRKKMAVAGGEA